MKLRWTKDRSNRFLDKVEIDEEEDECWWWIGAVNSSGYGQFAYTKTKIISAHKIMWALVKNDGYLSEPKDHVMHLCDNKVCVNPTHLMLGTPAENDQMAVDRGMKKSIGEIVGRPVLKRYCRHGHRRTPENTIYKSKNGYRYPLCHPCVLEQSRRARAKLSLAQKAAYQRDYRERQKLNPHSSNR